MPQSNRIAISLDVTFDEYFNSAVTLSWKPFQDALTLRPTTTTIPSSTSTLEYTGSASDFPTAFAEGNSDNHSESTSVDDLNSKTINNNLSITEDNFSDTSSTASFTEVQGFTAPFDLEQTDSEVDQPLSTEQHQSEPTLAETDILPTHPTFPKKKFNFRRSTFQATEFSKQREHNRK